MRILHVVQRYYPALGGAELHLQAITDYLVKEGHEVWIATTDSLDFELFWNPALRRIPEARTEVNGAQVIRFPVRHLPLAHLSFPAIKRALWILSKIRPVPVGLMNRLAHYAPWVPDLNKWLDASAVHFDLVGGMTISFESLLIASQSYANKQHIPFVAFPLTHMGAGPAPGEDSPSRFYTMRHQRAIVLRSDALIAQTQSEKEYYVSQGMSPDKIAIGGPGVTPENVLGGDGRRFRDKHGIRDSMVLCLGSMAENKGTVDVVEAVRVLWREGRTIELVLIGAVLAPFRAYLEQLPSGDRARIRLLGPVGDDEKRDALAAADLMALPSRTDSFGIVYLEAWLYGKPVIGARTWGVMDVIDHGQDGLLVPFGDVPELAKAIVTLVTNRDEATLMGKRGREKVYREHTWEQKCRLVARVYEELTH